MYLSRRWATSIFLLNNVYSSGIEFNELKNTQEERGISLAKMQEVSQVLGAGHDEFYRETRVDAYKDLFFLIYLMLLNSGLI